MYECIKVVDTCFPIHYVTLLGIAYEREMDYVDPNIIIIFVMLSYHKSIHYSSQVVSGTEE
jgi:hypothetical protein